MGSSISCITEIDMANKLLPAAVIASRSKHSATKAVRTLVADCSEFQGFIKNIVETKGTSLLRKFVEAEIKSGVPIENIVIGGFSQGGSVALYNALTSTLRYGGVVAFSCWLPLHTKFMSSPTLLTMPKDVPVFQCHGLEDYTIPFAMGKLTHELLKTFQLSKCELNCYPQLSHSSCEKVNW
ncbi:lysophospholipase II [Schistosoma bovis]|uniref:palmitoyl-protein hydrolase n=1 Tax=Schistosoma bovis TaxID=6184 RepID=A0A430QQE6_SCHBO|nr:lysophospholipase II [Schistosoma bovis]